MKFPHAKKIFLILFLGILIFISCAAANPVEENYQQIQKSLELMKEISGTNMTSAEYMEIVWPQVYQKISEEEIEKLSKIDHVWELKPMDENGLGFTINDKWGPERFALMDAMQNLEITEAEYQAITQTELYLDMEDPKFLNGIVRIKRVSNANAKTLSITEGETQWFSKNIQENVTRLGINLDWENPEGIENILSITIYSPDKCVFGPFDAAQASDLYPQKMNIHTSIYKPDFVACGEWWYSVKGVKVNGSQVYRI